MLFMFWASNMNVFFIMSILTEFSLIVMCESLCWGRVVTPRPSRDPDAHIVLPLLSDSRLHGQRGGDHMTHGAWFKPTDWTQLIEGGGARIHPQNNNWWDSTEAKISEKDIFIFIETIFKGFNDPHRKMSTEKCCLENLEK